MKQTLNLLYPLNPMFSFIPSVEPFYRGVALISLLPHKPGVGGGTAADAFKLAVHGAFQS